MRRPAALWEVEAGSLARLAASERMTFITEVRYKRHNEPLAAIVDHHVPAALIDDAPPK